MTAVADVSKGQRDMSYKGELQTLTKLSKRHQVGPSVQRMSMICHLLSCLIHSHVIAWEMTNPKIKSFSVPFFVKKKRERLEFKKKT